MVLMDALFELLVPNPSPPELVTIASFVEK
jgi:hypothetical protein